MIENKSVLVELEHYSAIQYRDTISERLNEKVNEEIVKHNNLGYYVVTMTPLTRGNFGENWGRGYTSGVLIVFAIQK